MDKTLSYFQEKKHKSEITTVISIIVFVLGIVFFVISGERTWLLTLGALFAVPGFIGIVVGVVLFNRTISKFKSMYLKDYFSNMIENGEYRPKRGLTQSEVYRCGFIKRADRFKSYDYLSGRLDGIDFRSSDVHLQERQVYTDSKGNRKTRYVTFFKGRVFEFDFPKKIEHRLQVLERYRPLDGFKYKKVDLESMAFNKKFNTYATDAHTAFYVLTPHFMESLMKVEKNHPGKIGFSFFDEQMHFAINNNKSTFAISPFRKIDEKLVETFKEDVEGLYEIVDDLKLNRNIFKEE